jgi:alpha-galactosidase
VYAPHEHHLTAQPSLVYYETLSFISFLCEFPTRKSAMRTEHPLLAAIFLSFFFILASTSVSAADAKIENAALLIEVSQHDGTYTIRSKDNPRVFVAAAVAAEVNHRRLRSADYPQHDVQQSSFTDSLGAGSQLTMTYGGLSGEPDLSCVLRLRTQPLFAEIEVQVRNHTGEEISVQSVRVFDGHDAFLSLDGPDSADRVLSDSFSEDRPNMKIHDLDEPYEDNLRAVGSQLIYNRQSRQSLFVGALTSEKWLTVLRLWTNEKKNEIAGYEVDSTGTTELLKENSLRDSSEEDRVELSLPVEPGQSLSSERVAISLSSNNHAQLETYGDVIRRLHSPRVGAPTPIGWWSWTAYYFGLTEGPALTNAEFLAQRLRDSGYTYFHIDEGYQFARGDYTTPVATKYPHGLKNLERKVQSLGLTPGIWTAPFEVSERSSIFANHKDWLVHNAKGEPIHAGWVTEPPDTHKKLDQLYVLDTTNPAAQKYLRETYSTLTKDWGVRYIKLDFMDDTAIEGYYYRPHTTALEAQRIGLQVIREAVGDDVLLDKDGSVMLNPVGLVDTGRISCDTGHSFEASRDAAPGIAARYYMNRNFYIADPDAFSVSRESSAAQGDHGGPKTLTLEEAQVAIALAAVSGGMYEIGDDLPTLFLDADRMNLLQNRDLLNMVRLGRAAQPLDLMSYAPEDEMPSVFLLRESNRQAILVVFNWTKKEREHTFSYSELGFGPHLAFSDVFGNGASLPGDSAALSLNLAPHSVGMVKIVDSSVAASAPSIKVHLPEKIETGKMATFSAESEAGSVPALLYHWDFGDGTSAEGASVTHAYTHAGSFTVRLRAEGIEGVAFEKSFAVSSTGTIDTIFRPERYEKYVDER